MSASGRPRESWLRLDNPDHDQFAAAMMLCRDGSGACARRGVCTWDGDCFRRAGRGSGGDLEHRVAALEERVRQLTEMLERRQ